MAKTINKENRKKLFTLSRSQQIMLGVFLILISKLWFSSAAPLASTIGILLLTQISLGIINVIYVLPLYVAIAHNLVAATLLLAIFTVNYLAWKK